MLLPVVKAQTGEIVRTYQEVIEISQGTIPAATIIEEREVPQRSEEEGMENTAEGDTVEVTREEGILIPQVAVFPNSVVCLLSL